MKTSRYRVTIYRSTTYMVRADDSETAVDMVLGAVAVLGKDGVKEESSETTSHTVEPADDEPDMADPCPGYDEQ